MTKLVPMLLICFAASFAAGTCAGVWWERNTATDKSVSPAAPPAPTVVPEPPAPGDSTNRPPFGGRPTGGPPNWTAELKLTAEQSEQMNAIWSDVMKKTWALGHDQRDAGRKDKEAGLNALLTADQKKSYEDICKKADAKSESFFKQVKALHEEAVEKTKKILTPEQALKYDEIRQKHEQQWRRGRPDNRQPGRPFGGAPDGKRDKRPDGEPEKF